VRTTLTLEDDIARLLQEEARRQGKPFKAVVNEALRRGVAPSGKRPVRTPYRVKVHGARLRPGFDLTGFNASRTSWRTRAFFSSAAAVGDDRSLTSIFWLLRAQSRSFDRHETRDPWEVTLNVRSRQTTLRVCVADHARCRLTFTGRRRHREWLRVDLSTRLPVHSDSPGSETCLSNAAMWRIKQKD